MVALTLRTWHGLMLLAQLFSIIVYIFSLFVLKDHFGMGEGREGKGKGGGGEGEGEGEGEGKGEGKGKGKGRRGEEGKEGGGEGEWEGEGRLRGRVSSMRLGGSVHFRGKIKKK